jgi:hypothetical protein
MSTNTSELDFSCSDSPLSTASSTVGFVTAFIAVVFAYYGFYNIFISAPRAFHEFMSELKKFQYRLGSLKEELFQEAEAERRRPKNEISLSLAAIEREQLSAQEVRVEAAETLKDARAIAESAEWIGRFRADYDKPVSNTSAVAIAIATVKAGLVWWWSYRDKANEIMARIASQKTNLLLL